MHAAATDPVGWHERAPGPDRQRGLVHLVAERERGLVRPQEQLVANAIAQFVLHVVWREIGRRIAPGTTLDGDDIEPFVGELVRHDRTGPAETDNDDVFFRKSARHDRTSARFRGPLRSARDADGRRRKRLIVTLHPVWM